MIKAFVLLCLAAAPLAAQTAKPVSFEIADVRVSPHRNYPEMGDNLRGDRYVIRQATMVDLIAMAYDLDAASVQGGPAWLERQRFDIIARVPRTTTKPQQKLMLQTLLTERFQLTTHIGSKPMPAFVLSLARG